MAFSQNLFRTIDGRHTHLIIVATSSAVEATLVYYENNQAKTVIAHVEQSLGLSLTPSKDQVYDATITVLHDVCTTISGQSQALFANSDLFQDHQTIDQVSLFVSAPWVHKHYYNQSRTWDKETVIETADLQSLINTDLEQGFTRLDTHVAYTKLNDYIVPTKQVLGQTAHSIDMAVVDMTIRINQAETLFQVVHSCLNTNEEQFRIMPITSALLDACEQSHSPRGLFAELFMYDSFSDVLVFDHGQVIYGGSIQFGTNTITAALLDNQIAPTIDQALSLIRLGGRGSLTPEVEQTLREHSVDITTKLEHEFHALDHELTMPRDWYVYANHDNKEIAQYICSDNQQIKRFNMLDDSNFASIAGKDHSLLSRIAINFLTNYRSESIIR